MDRFSTHLELLTAVCNFIKPKEVIEFGMGDYSTPLLFNNSSNLTSIEMQSESWYNMVNDKFTGNEKWNPILCLGDLDFMNLTYTSYDLAFVDGHQESRPDCVNLISKYCNTIVSHDTEATFVYRWNRVDLPDFYTFEDRRNEPWTKVWTKNKDLISYLEKNINSPEWYSIPGLNS